MSPTSTPTDLFQHLSLGPQMSPTSAVVQSRAAEMRDVLSSFDREIFPAEYRTDIFDRLDRPVISRPQMQSEWTVQQDLVATLLQWGSYDEDAFRFLQRIQPAPTRTRLFHEKLSRRFQDIFHNYDVLHGTVSTSQEAHNHVQALADSFVMIIRAVHEDRRHRELGQPRTAGLVLGALLGVCARHEDIMLSDLISPGSDRSGATTSGLPRSDTSLFQALVRDSGESQRDCLLVLDLLESYPPAITGQHKSEYDELVDLLSSKGAPKTYIDRAVELQAIAQEHAPPLGSSAEEKEDEPESALTMPAPTVPTAARRAVRTGSTRTTASQGSGPATSEARAGSKRSATTEETSKRGRKKTSK